jgi:hypothetical protein
MKRATCLPYLTIAFIICHARYVCGDTPQNYYSYQDMEAGGKVISNPFGSYRYVRDFGISVANRDVDNTITIELVADDPYFEYDDGSTGTYTYDSFDLDSFQGRTLNVIGPAVCLTTYWEGTINYESDDSETFWTFPPSDFDLGRMDTPQTPWCDIYKAAWLNASWWSPVYWDDDVGRLISPEGVYWHNDNWWDQGWKSTIYIYNNTGYTQQYTITFYGTYLAHTDGTDCCQADDPPYKSVQRTLQNQQTLNETIYSLFNFSTSERYRTEGAITIYVTNPIAGNEPSHSISKNSGNYTNNICTGTGACQSTNNCPLRTQCP